MVLADINQWLLLNEQMKYPIGMSNDEAYKYAIAFLANDIIYIKNKLKKIFEFTYPIQTINELIISTYTELNNFNTLDNYYVSNLHYLEEKDFDINYYDCDKKLKKIKFDYYINNKNLINNSQVLELIKSDISIQMEGTKKNVIIQNMKNKILLTISDLTNSKTNELFTSLCYCKLLSDLLVNNGYIEDMDMQKTISILDKEIINIHKVWEALYVDKLFLNYTECVLKPNTTEELKNRLSCLEHITPNLYNLITVNIETSLPQGII